MDLSDSGMFRAVIQPQLKTWKYHDLNSIFFCSENPYCIMAQEDRWKFCKQSFEVIILSPVSTLSCKKCFGSIDNVESTNDTTLLHHTIKEELLTSKSRRESRKRSR